MRYSDELKTEHGAVLMMAGILEGMAERLEGGSGAIPADMEKADDFLTVFVDMCHHGKEERFLFPALEEAGVGRRDGLIPQLLREHEAGREHTRGMREARGRYAEGDPSAARVFAEEARAYVALIRRHIRVEDEVLFPASDAQLSGVKQEELAAAFDDLERNVIGEGRHEQYHAMLKELRARYRHPVGASA